METNEEFPTSKYERGKVFAKTGLKVGSNYAKYLAKKSIGQGDKSALHEQNAQDVFKEMSKLRGLALKIAQALSMDSGMMPEEFMEVMAQAQYSVPPMNRALVRKLFHDAFGNYPEQVFASFEPDAIAAASIGQVHRAVTKEGQQVVVKIQYPNVRQTVDSDLMMAKGIVSKVIRSDKLEGYFEEVHQKFMEETDYLNEGKQIEFFANQYQHENIITPRWLPEYSTDKVLTMTYLEGVHLDSFLAQNPEQEEKNYFGQLLWDFVSGQIASTVCTVHADIHPGNFLFRTDKKLGVLDFGCIKAFPQEFRDDFILLYDAQIRGDATFENELYERLEITDKTQENTKEQEAYKAYFKSFGQTIVKPFRYDTFTFGEEYQEELFAQFRKAKTFRTVTGSKHFIFVNKIMMGLFSVLIKLKPTIDMRKSRQAIDEAVQKIPH